MSHLSTQEVEAGGNQVWGQPGLHSETLLPLVPTPKERYEGWGPELCTPDLAPTLGWNRGLGIHGWAFFCCCGNHRSIWVLRE